MSEDFTTTKPEGWGEPQALPDRAKAALDQLLGQAPPMLAQPAAATPNQFKPMSVPDGTLTRVLAVVGLIVAGLASAVFGGLVLMGAVLTAGLAFIVAEIQDRRGEAIELERRKQLGVPI